MHKIYSENVLDTKHFLSYRNDFLILKIILCLTLIKFNTLISWDTQVECIEIRACTYNIYFTKGLAR